MRRIVTDTSKDVSFCFEFIFVINPGIFTALGGKYNNSNY